MSSQTSFDLLINQAKLGAFMMLGILVLIILALIGFQYWIFMKKFRNRKRSLKEKVFLKIQIPEDNEIEPAAAEQMYSSFYGIRKSGFWESLNEQDHISFEIVGTKDSIDFYAVCPESLANLVEKQINAAYPEAEILRVEPWNIWDDKGKVEFSSLVLKKENYLPINSYDDMKVDSMAVITSGLSKLHEGEGVAFQMLIRPAEDSWQKSGKTHMKEFYKKHNETDKDGKPKGPRMGKMEEDYLLGIQEKIAKVGFETVIRLVSVSVDEASAKANLSNLERAFGLFDSPVFNSFKKAPKRFPRYFVLGFLARMFPVIEKFEFPFEINLFFKKEYYKSWSIFNTEELATLWHMPSKTVRTPRINWLRSKGSAAPIELPTSGLYLGQSIFRGQEIKIFMRDDDRRRHR